MSNYKEIVEEFIVENFLFGEKGDLTEETSFMDSGIIDSTGMLELITFIEQKYDIKVNDNELVPENLDSLVNINQFLQSKIPNGKD